MQDKNRFALKEWAVVLKALSEGRQTILLRKGGLIEKKVGFTIEHAEFFIYPTYLHQQRMGVVPEAAADLEQLFASPPPEDRIILSHYAVVEEAVKITDMERLRTLEGYHYLNTREVEKRFFYGKAPGLHLILLRVYRLPEPFRLRPRPHYAGCRSWVDLGEELWTAGCRPVLDDAAFDKKTVRIAEILSRSAQSYPSD
ncbi:MAG: DUF1802 family protein [Nitrospirae bacterium]|nr:DUF1802 family protein [Nitrospirota bacterium]